MIMSRADCIKQFGSDYFIRKKLNSGELHRIDKGIFTDDIFVPELAIISYKYPNSVVTMISAFYRYGLTDKIPDKIDLATDRDASKISDSRVRQYFTPKGLFTLGVTTIQERGYELQIYNLERMLIELLRYKSKLPFDLYKEILLNYRKIMHQLDIQLIQDYALSAPKSNMILNSLQLEVL